MTENEKDSTTEKEVSSHTPLTSDVKTVDDEVESVKKDCVVAEEVVEANIDGKNSTDETKNGAENDETEAEDSARKPKKEKVKKRWSFRSFSFSKKDKQKPVKKEEAVLTNGECEKVPEEVSKNIVYIRCS